MGKYKYDAIIAELLKELDDEYAEYQRLHRRFYMEEDEEAKVIYTLIANSYKRVLKNLKGNNE